MKPSTTEARYASPVGELLLVDAGGTLVMCDWLRSPRHARNHARIVGRYGAPMAGESQLLTAARQQLDEYFAGLRCEFALPVSPIGTPFELTVWEALRSVGYGQSATYADVARRIGRPTAVRAVAAAIGRNPLSIFIPCHRILGSNGALTGYAGSLPAKSTLLALESRIKISRP